MDNSILKFRVWYNGDYSLSAFCNIDMNGNVWLADTDGANECDFINITDKCTVEYSTGLRDKNNNLIYENDLVKDQFGAIYQVIWQDDFASFYLMLQSGHPEFLARIFENESLEIIGNIHTQVKE